MNKKVLLLLILNFLSFSTVHALKIEEISDAPTSSVPLTKVNCPEDKIQSNSRIDQPQKIISNPVNIFENIIPFFDDFFNAFIIKTTSSEDNNEPSTSKTVSSGKVETDDENVESFKEFLPIISIIFTDVEIAPLNPVIEKMVDWFKEEYASLCNPKILNDDLSLRLVAEATYWISNSSLKEFVDAMTSYKEVASFRPLEEMFNDTSIGKAVQEVANNLIVPSMSYEASYALKNGANLIYAKKVGKEVFDREQAEFNAQKSQS